MAIAGAPQRKHTSRTFSLYQSGYFHQRQMQLFRDLEVLLELTPSTFSSPLLALPLAIREHIYSYILPVTPHDPRPELHTCLWTAEMSATDPWRHDIFSYASSVPKIQRLHPSLLLINKQLRAELLAAYFRRSNLTLHAELRNTPNSPTRFTFSPHVPLLPLLEHVSHVRFYIEWSYTTTKHDIPIRRARDTTRMTAGLRDAVQRLLQPLETILTIDLTLLFFWKQRSGKKYALAMQDLFELEGVLKRDAEAEWLALLRHPQRSSTSSIAPRSPDTPPPPPPKPSSPPLTPPPGAGASYRVESEKAGTEQSGGMDICVSLDLERAMAGRGEGGNRGSKVDWYGNYGIVEELPCPGYRVGAMI